MNIKKQSTSYTNTLNLSFNLPPIKIPYEYKMRWDSCRFTHTMQIISHNLKKNDIHCEVNSRLWDCWLLDKVCIWNWVLCIVVNAVLCAKQNKTKKNDLLFSTKLSLRTISNHVATKDFAQWAVLLLAFSHVSMILYLTYYFRERKSMWWKLELEWGVRKHQFVTRSFGCESLKIKLKSSIYLAWFTELHQWWHRRSRWASVSWVVKWCWAR